MERHICELHKQHAQVLHAILNAGDEEEPFIPSDFYNEMKMSLDERLDFLYKNRKNRTLPQPSPFLATPDMIIFQNFVPGRTYNATLTLQNKEQTSRCIKVAFEPSVHFRLSYPTKVIWTKVAPGMTYQVIISFGCDKIRDYQHQVTFVTEEEQFSIPVYAFKPRPLLDCPDFVNLPDVPIHTNSEKSIILSNDGSETAVFNVIAKERYYVSPEKAILEPNEKMFLNIAFKTNKLGSETSSIILQFDDGIKLKIEVKCTAFASKIILDRNSISFDDTFMGLQRQLPITVEYRSIGVGYYEWKLYKDVQTEEMRKSQLKEFFEQIRDNETLKSNILTKKKIIDQEGHELVYNRILSDEVEEVEANEKFLFHSSAFSILPLTGDVNLNGRLEFTVIFHPKQSQTYNSVAYLEIAGKEERLPLKLQGTGLGPQFQLNVAHLEANNIFLRSVHSYEIVVANTGHIPGSITFLDKEREFGGKVQCEPETVHVQSNHFAVFIVSFTPGEEGKFIEKIEFVINESQENIYFIMTGNVIAPLLSLEVKEIDFGIIALGYIQQKEIVLYNNSPVPIQFHIEIENDGFEEAIDCESHLQGFDFPISPQEFEFEPEEGVLDEESKIIGMLSLLPNIKRQVDTKFIIHMWGSKNYQISVPLKFDCRVAEVICVPPKVDIKFCFTDYVYDRKIIIKNTSELPCHLVFVPTEEIVVLSINDRNICFQKEKGLMVEMTIPTNYIPPMGEIKIPLKIQTSVVGSQDISLYFKIFGNNPEKLCEIICNGQGPAICFIPPNLNFETLSLLRTVTKNIEILNDTPIPATINFSFKRPGPFSLKKSTLLMPPNSKQEIEISVYLTNPGKHSQVMLANVVNGQEVAVNLYAYGEGSSISCIPKLENKLDFGSLLTHKKYSFPVILRNEGSRWHKLWLSRSNNLKIAKETGNSSGGFNAVFKIIPNYFHLMTNESCEIKILGSRKEPEYVSEHYYCHAVIEKSHTKHIIFSFEVSAKFVDPQVIFSKSELNFFLNISSNATSAHLQDKLKIRNESGLPLEIDLSIKPPFYIVLEDKTATEQLALQLNHLSYRTIYIEFQPPPHVKRSTNCNQILYVSYRDHPKVDTIPIRGVIHYPTLSIQPQSIDFGCIPLGSSTQRSVILQNISPLPVIFKWLWIDDIVITKLENSSQIPSSPQLSRRSLCEDTPTTVLTEKFVEEDCFIEEQLRDMLNSLLDDVEEGDKEDGEFISLLPKEVTHTKFSQIFTIIPHEGCLEPDEAIVAHFNFVPQENTEVSATVYCHIVGGANELVQLSGKCRQISYCVEENYVHFGKIHFMETSENKAYVTNDGEGKFTFTLSEAYLPSGSLIIEPKSASVIPNENFPLILKCFPGTLGRFETKFDVEIEYLEPTTITVIGFGVYPQIYLSLSRPFFNEVDPDIAYSAIAELGDEPIDCKCVKEYFPEIDKQILEEAGWVVITLLDQSFPCTMEIDLSIERIHSKHQLHQISQLSNKLLSGERYWNVPSFSVPPYIYDLGCVQINTKNLYALNYLNYGPGRTFIKTHSSSSFQERGFDIRLTRLVVELNRTSNISFSFNPSSEKYREITTKVTEFIYIDIKNGPRVPIQLEVIVTKPTIRVSHGEVDFGSVRCGDCLRKSVKLSNDGYLRSGWKATIDENLKVKSKSKTSFFLLQHDGMLEPGEKFYLRIYFEPHYDDYLFANLTINVEGNNTEHVITLKGFGMEPFLEIFDDRIGFEPNIPYSSGNEKFVTIKNASKFPVEFFFPDFDEKIKLEESYVRSYILGNHATKAYFPYRASGEDLPVMFEEYYNALLQEIEPKLPEIKSFQGGFRESSNICSSPKDNLFSQTVSERDNIIINYFSRKMKHMSRNNFCEGTHSRLSADYEILHQDPPSKGALVVFHGPPNTQYLKAAHQTAKLLNMKVYSIDSLIVECLIQNSAPAIKQVNEIINEAVDEVAEENELDSSSIAEDTFDMMLKKVAILLEGRKKKKKAKSKPTKADKGSSKSSKSSKKSKSTSEKSSKKSNSNSKKKKKNMTDTLINIDPSLLLEVLKESVKRFPTGVIIENLSSNFLRNTVVALKCILQLSKNFDDLYFVIFACTFDDYLQVQSIEEKTNEENSEKNLRDFNGAIDEMEEEEFERFKEQHPDAYAAYLKKRKEDSIKRNDLIKQLKLKQNTANKNIEENNEGADTEKSTKKSRDTSRSSGKKTKSDKDQTKKKKGSSKDSKKSKKDKSSEKTKSSKKSGSSKKSQKSSKNSKKQKLTKSETEMKVVFDSYENTLREILHILQSWDRKQGLLTVPFHDKSEKKTKKVQKAVKEVAKSEISSISPSAASSPSGAFCSHSHSSDVGVPCWLLNKSLNINFENFIPHLMKATVLNQFSHRKQMIDEHTEPSKLQSVLTKPKPRLTKKTEEFVIVDYIEEKDVLGNLLTPSAMSGTLGSKISLPHSKKKSSKIRSLKSSSYSLNMKEKADMFTHRAVLEPGAEKKFKIKFLPKSVGNYKHVFNVGVVGWNAKFPITCIAISDIPRIDMTPCTLFDRVIQHRTDKNKYTRDLFVEHTNTFDFGGILLPTDRCFESKTFFHLNNISRITCDVTFGLENVSPAFQFQPDSYIIEPKEKKDLMVTAAPLEEHIFEDSLIVSIKNNPKIDRIMMSCYGCNVGIDVNPKHVVFERVTLEISLTQNIIITNNTPIEVFWHFLNCQEVLENFKIDSFGGKILPFSYQTASVQFTAMEMEVRTSTFQVHVYDNQQRLLYSTDVMVSAETTALEFKYNNEINYGDVKGKKSHQLPFVVTNIGRYELLCRFSEIGGEQEDNQIGKKYFRITPLETKLLPNVKFSATVTFTPDKVMTLEKYPVFTCLLIDPFHQVLIKSFDITVSAKVHLSKFIMCPYPEIYFGYQTVGSQSVHMFQITNKGKFDFTYDINNHKTVTGALAKTGKKKSSDQSKSSKSDKSKSTKDSKKSKSTKDSKKSGSTKESKKSKSTKDSKKSKDSKNTKSSKTTKSSKSEKKKQQTKTLHVGIFSLTSSVGNIGPNEEAIIEVRSHPIKAGDHHETIIVNVSEPSPADKNGKILKIRVIACEPKVNFDEINNIFKEQYIVEKMDDILASNNEARVVFAKSEMKLKFNKVCVNTTETTRIRIQNIGHVPAQVTAQFSEKGHVFTVSPESFSIDPYQTANVTIIFTPNSLDQHQTTLNFVCRGYQTLDTLTIEVIGESCVPEIVVLKPLPDEESVLRIDFPLVLVGSCVSGDITVKNAGIIPCKVIMEVCFDDYSQISLTPKNDTTKILDFWDPNTMKHTNLVNLERNREAHFVIKFEPTRSGVSNLEIKIHTVNNPFETKTIYLFCEGYYFDIILEGLPSVVASLSADSDMGRAVITYSLDFGHISLNTLEKKCFTLRNNSDVSTYKFQFPTFHEVIFSPAVGHIKPKTEKQILAVFLSKTPVKVMEASMKCEIFKIEYPESESKLLSWDDRQYLVVWCSETIQRDRNLDTASQISSITKDDNTSSMGEFDMTEDGNLNSKMIEDNPEPKHTVVADSYQNIALFFTVVADYVKFSCEVEELSIPDTFLMNKQSVDFDVENIGNVIMKINWTISINDVPRRINSGSSVQKEKTEFLPKISSTEKSTPLSDNEEFVYTDPPSRPATSSTLFNSETSDSVRSADTWNEFQSLPFTVTPRKCCIEINKKQTFTVTFAPNDVYDYVILLKSCIENKSPELNDIEIRVKARSILPVYCFDLDCSDYVKTRRGGKKMCNDLLDENTKIVEFDLVGLGFICTKKFYLKNPTKEEFYYNWQPAHPVNPHLSCFHCHTSSGVVYKGKSVEIVFSFVPQEVGVFEEFYYFNIPLKNIQETFLLVGTSREPRVYFDQNHIVIPSTVSGIDVEENIILKNEESQKYSFKFGKFPMLAKDITIEPISGFINPDENLAIKITYSPKKRGSFTFDLKCVIDKIKEPLDFTVSCTCYEVEAQAFYSSQNEEEMQLCPNKLNVINMGLMTPLHKYKIPFTVVNIGKIGFKWYWSMHLQKISGLFDVLPDFDEGTLLPNEVLHTNLTIMPLINCRMQPHKIQFIIPYGPSYAIEIGGNAGRPPFKLSMTRHDFGNCLVQKSPTKYYKTILKFSNLNIFPMTLEKGSHPKHVSTDFQAAEIPPQTNKDITIYFHPLILGHHEINLPFYLDGKKTHVNIYGKAVPLKLTFINQTDKFVDLGPVLVGKKLSKTIRVLNESECSINILFNFWDRLPKKKILETPEKLLEVPHEEHTKVEHKKDKDKKKNKKESKSSKSSTKSKKTKKTKSLKSETKSKKKEKKGKKKNKSSSKSSKKKHTEIPDTSRNLPLKKKGIDFITITPDKCIRVGSQKTFEFTVTFSPLERVEPFVEKIFYQTQNYIDAFCMIKGSSIAPDVSLDRNSLTFGNVVVNFQKKINVVLRNTGDISLKFNWLLSKKEENFTVSPRNGYILPGTDFIFDVTFSPKTVKCWIKSKLTCCIIEINKKLELFVAGSCINVPPPKEIIHFSCPVRENSIKIINIFNPTNQIWQIQPNITGSTTFKTLQIVRIPPKSEGKIEIVYAPMVLKEHNASLCIPTPDGLIVSYTLEGVAVAPSPVRQITRDVLCKVQHIERLTVTNWLLVKQQFHVATSVDGPSKAKNLYTVTGNSLIEVPPSSTRIYDWSITPINEGPLHLKVTFTNKVTQEYLFYDIILNVLPNKKLESIDFETCARVPITKLLKLENPLNVPIDYHLSCPSDFLVFKNHVHLEPHSVYYLEITYRPLWQEKDVATFEATCKEMGTFSYSLLLTGHAAVPEPVTIFKTFLGQTLTQNIQVVQTKGCKFEFDNPAFSVDHIIGDYTLCISYEPFEIGKCQSQLVVQSLFLGEFVYPLIGDCCSPKPQGPFSLAHSSPAVVLFKNPFFEEKMFYFRTESPNDFSIKLKSASIESKKVYKIVVNLVKDRRKDEVKYPITGKLTVSCNSPSTSWVYYLQENIE